MSTLAVNTITAETGTTITVPTGKKLIGTDNSSIAAPGMVVQVVKSTSNATFSTASTSFTAVGNLTGVITTTQANSKILVTMTCPVQLQQSNSIRALVAIRSSLDSYASSLFEQPFVLESNWIQMGNSLQFLHSPSQSSGTEITYKAYAKRAQGSGSLYMPDAWGIVTAGVPSSIVTLMEIA